MSTPIDFQQAPAGVRERALAAYEQFLVDERGLAPRTVQHYLRAAAVLTDTVQDVAGPCWQALTPRVIADVVRAAASNRGPAEVQQLCVGLRSVLRYLRLRGDVVTDLASSVPVVAHWRLGGLPRCLTPHEVERVIDACGRGPTGRRDRAIVLLLARLGLRAIEVTRLTLDDIDWRTGVIHVAGKGADRAALPLSPEVGEAIAHYLRHVRPRTELRSVFLRRRVPRMPLTSHAITSIARRAIARAGVTPPRSGAHLFRHSLATRLLGAGASLAEVGQVLRHRHEDTTRLYAKVDLDRLRSIALPWPGSAS